MHASAYFHGSALCGKGAIPVKNAGNLMKPGLDAGADNLKLASGSPDDALECLGTVSGRQLHGNFAPGDLTRHSGIL